MKFWVLPDLNINFQNPQAEFKIKIFFMYLEHYELAYFPNKNMVHCGRDTCRKKFLILKILADSDSREKMVFCREKKKLTEKLEKLKSSSKNYFCTKS